MELDHEFTVPVPVERAWSVLLDVERVALCMPGATLDSAADEEYQGRLRVRVGAMTITYRGVARIVVADEGSRTLTIDARGKEARGSGTANATVQARLREEDGVTRVTVHTKLNVTGRPAQFGRNILSEVGGRLIGRFAKALAEELEAAEAEAADEAPVETPVERIAGAEASRPSVADRASSNGEVRAGDDAPAEVPPVPAVPRPRPASPLEQLPPEDRKAAPAPPERDTAAKEDAAPAPVTRIHPRREDDAIDLLEVAGPSIAKRAVPALGVVAFLLAVIYLLRRRRVR